MHHTTENIRVMVTVDVALAARPDHLTMYDVRNR